MVVHSGQGSATQKDELQSKLSDMRNVSNSSLADIGLTRDDLNRRCEEAKAPRSLSAGGKLFSIISTARSQQILQRGLADKMKDKRLREIEGKKQAFVHVRWFATFFGLAGAALLFYDVLLPRLQYRNERNERLRMRHELIFKPSLERRLREIEAEEKLKSEALAASSSSSRGESQP